MQQEQFEILLSRLASDELDPAGRSQLDSIVGSSPARAERRRKFQETLDLLDGIPASELVLPELEREYGDADDSGVRTLTSYLHARPVQGALGMAAALLIALAGWLLLRPGQATAPRAFVTHADGNCSSGIVRLAPGNTLTRPRVRSGPDSVCDIRIDFGGRVLVRLLPNSVFDYVHAGPSLTIGLERGELIVHSRTHDRQGVVRVFTPGHLIELLGTQVALKRHQHHEVGVDLMQGRAHVRTAHYLHMQALRHGVSEADRERLERELPELFKEHRQELSPGQSLQFRHPTGFKDKTAGFFDKLHAHITRALAPPDRQGAHRVTPELVNQMKSIYGSRDDIVQHLNAAPPRGRSEKLSGSREAHLRGHLEHAQTRSALHD